MRRFLRILKWIGIVILILVSGLTITVMARQNLKFKAPYPDIKASKDTAVIARGKKLIFGPAHCADCHSKVNADSLISLGQEVPLTGGFEFKMELGSIFTKNITPDTATGIGKYTDAEIARELRYGVRPDGTAVFDFMPFHNTSDEDLTAIISYLRAQKPAKNEIPSHTFNVMGKIVKAFLVKPVGPDGEVAKSVVRDTTAAYGKYLAMSVANCSGCHTKRGMTGEYIGEYFAGGGEFDGFSPPNLTPDSSGRIVNWSQQNFIDRFRMGKLYKASPMPWNSFKRMSDDELKAIYKFLKSLKPMKTGQEKIKK